MIKRYDPRLERTKDTVSTYMCLGAQHGVRVIICMCWKIHSIMHFIRILSLSFQFPKVHCISMLKNEENYSRNCLRMLNFASLLHLEETSILKSCYNFVCRRFCTELLPFLLEQVTARNFAQINCINQGLLYDSTAHCYIRVPWRS